MRRFALAVGLAASLTVAPAGPAGAIGAAGVTDDDGVRPAPTWTYAPDEPIADGDIAARAIGESITHGEAERRLRADRAASHVHDIAAAQWPDTFAGLWIDHDPYRINVAFTRDATANVTDLRDEFPYPADLHPVDAAHSLPSLRALQGRLASERTSIQMGSTPSGMPEPIRSTRGRYDLDIDVPAGQVVVRVERATPSVREAFTRRYGGPIVVREGISMPLACVQDDCRHAMLGGLKLNLGGPSSGYCSSGFPAYLSSNSAYRYVLSAGHCYADSYTIDRYNGGEFYGAMTAHKMAGEVDVERIRRDAYTPWRESSKFIVQGEQYPRLLNTVMSYADIKEGAYIGKTGASTGTTRGYVTSLDEKPWYVTGAHSFIGADMCGFKGDSGGAVWASNSGYGIVSGGTTLTKCRDINGKLIETLSTARGTIVFGALSYAAAAMGVTVMTGVNLRPTAEFTTECLLLDCTFDASASKDHDGGITSYTWDFGDGKSGTGRTVTHSYLLPGPHTVTLTLKDNNGVSTSLSKGIVVTAS